MDRPETGAASSRPLRHWLKLAERAARRAGDFLAELPRAEIEQASHFGRDVKLEADRAVEERILDVLLKESPFDVLAEESGMHRGEGSHPGLRWIVDPLDGSLNFLRGIPLCCVSVGLWREDEPVLGVVYDFNRDEIFTGVVGEGAERNEQGIQVSCVREPAQATLSTGFPAGSDFSAAALGRFVSQVQQYKKVRLLGSAALSLAYVAAGRVDAYREHDIKIWDVAAGLALVRAAGGETVVKSTAVLDAFDVYASNEGLIGYYRNGD